MTVAGPSQFSSRAQVIVKSLAVIGFILFALLMSATFLDKDYVQRTGQSFIQGQIKAEMIERREAASETPLGSMLEKLAENYDGEIASAQEALDKNLDVIIAEAIARLCQMDCNKKESLRQSLRDGFDAKMKRFNISSNNIEQYVQGKYTQTVKALKQDLRIFAGTNLFLFALIFLAMLVRKRARDHLLLPACLLLIATVLATCLYVFGQNWFYTIVFNNYWGYAYSAYAGIIFLLLLDIFLNKARITTELLNAFFRAIGSALEFVAC